MHGRMIHRKVPFPCAILQEFPIIFTNYMANGHVLTHQKTKEAMVKIPLSAFRYLSRYPREKKIVVEISTDDIVRMNSAETLDEIINEARLDYALGNFSVHKSAKSLIAALRA